MIIDMHTHAYSEQIARRTMSKLRGIIGREPAFDGTVDGLKGLIASVGVDRALILPIATKPSQHEVVNEWAAQQNSGNIMAFGSVHPACTDPYGDLKRIRDLGIKGIKLHPDYQATHADDPSYYLIYEAAQELGLIIEFHCGYDSSSPDHPHCTPSMLRGIIRDFPRLKVIGGHLGGHKMWDEVEKQLAGLDLYLECSLCAGQLAPDVMRRICDRHSPDRLLFGSDAPWRDMALAVRYIQELKLPGDREDKLFSRNAIQLLGV